MEAVELELREDNIEYFYKRKETFTIRFARNISSSSNIIQMFRQISEQYILIQESKSIENLYVF